MWIQIILLLGIAATVIPLSRAPVGARHQAIQRLLVIGAVALAALAVLFPNWFTAVANAVGVGRGADLLLYLLVIAFLGYGSSSYRRISVLDRKVTILIRKLALQEAALLATTEKKSTTPEIDREPGSGPRTIRDDGDHAPSP